ncbi:uncharacterized protein LOC144115091 isoform X2 [Amblyomma americanum]
MAKRDPCVSDCSLVFVYAGAIFIALFFTFLLRVATLTALLRSTDESIKSTGFGVNYVAIRLLGKLPRFLLLEVCGAPCKPSRPSRRTLSRLPWPTGTPWLVPRLGPSRPSH